MSASLRGDGGAGQPLPLAGLSVLEFGGGAAAAYAGRLLADAGATVHVAALHADRRLAGLLRADTPVEEAYVEWLMAGKRLLLDPIEPDAIVALAAQCDLLVIGEDAVPAGPDTTIAATLDAAQQAVRVAAIRLHWFGPGGPRSGWRGSDLVVQSLTGVPQMAGAVEGPPLAAGDRQATLIGGVTAYIAACAAVLGAPDGAADRSPLPRRLEVSILEANLVMAEMHWHFFERDGLPMRRCGLNRFAPNSPVGIYPCADGWVGITVATPDQWRALCQALELHAQAADQGLVTRERRFERLDEVERVLCEALARRSAAEWAAVGRRWRVPIVVVPNAAGLLRHPVFDARGTLIELPSTKGRLTVPRAPFGLTATPVGAKLLPAHADPVPALPARTAPMPKAQRAPAPDAPPLAGLTVVDFTMGWAGPLCSRLLADLGAEVLKIEAGRYPDWWRGMNWTADFIESRLYERSTIFCGMNRGKQGLSLDLTTRAGRDLALQLVARADAVVENQAAGVMAKFGLDEPQLRAVRPELVMLSMSAFGTGNAWSDTRAYGSTLEQGSGLPSLVGFEADAPTMTHLAQGDPVGGLYGCAALLTALVHRRRTGKGQYVNLGMVETMLPFTVPGLLLHQVAPGAPLRRGNRRDAMSPHGFYRAAGEDQWVAIAVGDAEAFAALAQIIGRPDWADQAALATLAGRRDRQDEIDAAITAWTQDRPAAAAAGQLQAAGVAAAELLHCDALGGDAHLAEVGFFVDLTRAISGPQRQCGLAIRQQGQRFGARGPAPLLGEHTAEVLLRHLGLDATAVAGLMDQGVIRLAPRPERNLLSPPPRET